MPTDNVRSTVGELAQLPDSERNRKWVPKPGVKPGLSSMQAALAYEREQVGKVQEQQMENDPSTSSDSPVTVVPVDKGHRCKAHERWGCADEQCIGGEAPKLKAMSTKHANASVDRDREIDAMRTRAKPTNTDKEVENATGAALSKHIPEGSDGPANQSAAPGDRKSGKSGNSGKK